MHQLRRYLGFSLLAACGAVSGCSSEPDPGTTPDLATRLESDTGVKWTVYVDPRSNEVRFLAPEKPISIGTGTPEENARAFFDRYRDALHASGNGDEIRIVSTATDARGGIHIRFTHFLPGTDLPVFDSGSTAHFTADGSVYWLQADFRADLAALDGVAALTKDEATARALAHVTAACGAIHGAPLASAAELGVLSDPETHAALAYRVRVSVQSERCGAPSVFVDAKSGAALKIEEGAHHIDTPMVGGARFHRLADKGDTKQLSVKLTGTSAAPKYEMTSDEEASTRVITHSFGNPDQIIESTSTKVWDDASTAKGAAVDAHFYTRQALAFLRPFANRHEGHGRGFAVPLGLDVNVYVHDNSADTSSGANAYAKFDDVRAMDVVHFGDGNFPTIANALPWSTAYDIVAHEVTHLITDHTSKLKYERESGALSESFSDVMGAAAEHAVHPDDAKNFLIGEDLYVASLPGEKALRSMTAPASLRSPDHVEKQKRCLAAPTDHNDHCEVHSNSGIPNRAFSLMVAGGALYKISPGTVPELRPIGVPLGIGWEQATEITYWAMTGLNPTASFENAALAEIAEAGVVGGPVGTLTATCAWLAVGVLKPVADAIESYKANVYCKPPPQPPVLAPVREPAPGPTAGNVCSGHGDALICDPAFPAQAIRCKGGAPAPAETELCADPAQRCKPVSASDPTATKDDSGVLACE
jgi:Zn-dependent metalloprotease